MQSKRFIKTVFIGLLFIVAFVGGVNYVVDPYGIHKHSFLNINKPKQSDKIRLIKAIKVNDIKPKSIILGTSRAEYGYDPVHSYFVEPSYNVATSGSSMYENRLYFQFVLKQGNLKKVLLVIDYRMFNLSIQKQISDFESYFNNPNIYKYILSTDSFKDSFLTLIKNNEISRYLENGQIKHQYKQKNISNSGGHLAVMNKDESTYYKDYPTNYTYKDTKKSSFEDFEAIAEQCYKHDIELDIIFGPSHIRQWEALDYYLGYSTWLKWKKDVIISLDKIAVKYNKKQFRLIDFSVYHDFTAEEVPTDAKEQMKYHWEASHYKHELGLIVLDRLVGTKENLDFGVELNIYNIDEHLEKLKTDRYNFIDVDLYKEKMDSFLNK